jgi:hypothetical protein
MSDALFLQLAQILHLAFGLDPGITGLVLSSGVAVGSALGAAWGSWHTARFGWRTVAWLALGTAAGWRAFQRRRAITTRARGIVRQLLAAEEAKRRAQDAGELDLAELEADAEADARWTVDPDPGKPPKHAALVGMPAMPAPGCTGGACDVASAAKVLAAKHNRHPGVTGKGIAHD